jgi:hypothetical protein
VVGVVLPVDKFLGGWAAADTDHDRAGGPWWNIATFSWGLGGFRFGPGVDMDVV